MKRIVSPYWITCLILLCGCHFSAGYNKDLRTGLSIKYNGFSVKNVFIADSANRVMTDNKVSINSQIAIVALGVSNYELKDGKVFPGMMLTVTDKTGTAVLNVADLLANNQGAAPEQATELRGDITVARPMRAGETYHVKMRIWDKIKPSNSLDAETDIVVQ